MEIGDLKKEKIAIVAGGGRLPKLIIDELQAQQIPYIILALSDNTDAEVMECYQIIPGQVKSCLAILKNENVTSIVFAGHIKRPGLLSLKPDSLGVKLLARILSCKVYGDNTVLSIVAEFFEEQGFKVISPNLILPSLLAPAGILGNISPDQEDVFDILVGQKILDLLSPMDIGQAVIVENGYVLGIEAAEGTDNLIIRCATLKREQIKKGVLVKMRKNNQDNRLDLPTIGSHTIENAYQANLCGIAVNAQGSMIINFEEVIRLANKYGLFVVGVDEAKQ